MVWPWMLAVLCAVRSAAAVAGGGGAIVPPESSVVVLTQTGGRHFRVQALSPTMVRVEAEGPNGWEDRPTFLVQNRSEATGIQLRNVSATRAVSDYYAVDVGEEAGEVAIFGAAAGTALWQGSLADVGASAPMPQPAESFPLWAMADRPRFAAPPEGAVPGSAGGFDLTNQADDVYFFVSPVSSKLPYKALRAEVLRLIGPVPVLPDYAFGTMFTWYHNYTAAEKLAEIREFANRGIPLDVASLDMDWRLHPCYPNSLTPNCSDTPNQTERLYIPNTELIPHMRAFINAVHELNVSLFFNDHPMQPDPTYTELSPEEIQFRYDGLTSLLDDGLDFWWFDCHWHDLIPGIQCPGKKKGCDDGVDYATWGQYVEWSVMATVHQKAGIGKRTMMLGCQNPNMHRASHRTPVWWTGDNMWDALALGVQQTVDAGLDLKPYVHQDCGGHHGPGIGMTVLPDGRPNPWGHLGTLPYAGEVYARWLQYCSLGSVTRIHSAPSMSRLPWKFGAQAELVAKRFLRMRRSLAPMIISAARQVSLDGTPLVRRCDLIWPEHAANGANSSAQYMLADDLLVRPIDPFAGVPMDNATYHTYKPVDGKYNRDASIWLPPGEWHDAFSGEVLQGGDSGRILKVANQSVEHMPLYHRGGGAVITAAGTENQGAQTTWYGLGIHIWPTQASFASKQDNVLSAEGHVVDFEQSKKPSLAAPISRLLYAPSAADPDATALPLAHIKKTERLGAGFQLDFEATELAGAAAGISTSALAPQFWTLHVHVPLSSFDTTKARLRCGETLIPLMVHAPSQLYSGPFAQIVGDNDDSKLHAPELAPNAVLQARVVVGEDESSLQVRCSFEL